MRLFAIIHVFLLVLAALWVLGWLPVPAGYLQLQMAGWQLETSAANLTLAAALAFGLWRLGRLLLMLPFRLLLGLNTRRQQARLLHLLGAVVERDWPQVGQEARQELDRVAKKGQDRQRPVQQLLLALAGLHTGDLKTTLLEAQKVEAIPPLKVAGRMLRVWALHRMQGAEPALTLMRAFRPAPRHAGWLELELRLLAELEHWDEVEKLLHGRAQKLERGAPEGLKTVEQQLRLRLLARTEGADLVIQRWDDLAAKSRQKATEAMPVAIERLLELHQPQRAAQLLAEHVGKETGQTAVQLCFLLPPGNHCQPLLEAISDLAQRSPSDRSLHAAHIWLLLCCGQTDRALRLLRHPAEVRSGMAEADAL